MNENLDIHINNINFIKNKLPTDIYPNLIPYAQIKDDKIITLLIRQNLD